MDKTWRMGAEEFQAKYISWVRSRKRNIKKVDEWANWSLTPQEPEDIILRCLVGTIKYECAEYPMCFSYVARTSKLSEELLDDIMFITSGLFGFEYWCDEVVEFVNNLLKKGHNYDIIPDLRQAIEDNVLPKAFLDKCRLVIDTAWKQKIYDIESARSSIRGKILDVMRDDASAFRECEKLLNEKCYHDSLSMQKAARLITRHINRLPDIKESLNQPIQRYEDILRRPLDVSYVLIQERFNWRDIEECQDVSEEYLVSHLTETERKSYEQRKKDSKSESNREFE